jgi:hypothetical protein
MTSDNVEDRLARLRADWPAGSIVDQVMARIGSRPEPVPARRTRFPRLPRRPRLVAALAASGLFVALGLAWLLIAGHPTTLLAAIQDNLGRAASAHLSITFRDDRGQEHKSDVWYRRDMGLRAESPEGTLVEDGQFQWSWRAPGPGGELLVLRQPRPKFLGNQLVQMLALPDLPSFVSRDRAPELDREVNGRACLAYILTQTGRDPDLPPGAKPVNPRPFRGLILADADERIHQLDFQERKGDEPWHSVREIRIEYDVPVPAERIAVRLPEGARVIDRDNVFSDRYPLDRAIHRVELGSLLFAVHDIHPLINREGFYVVSSVRGTAELLRKFPPRRRWLNPALSELDVAFQMTSNGMISGKYDRIGLGTASREGVEFAWSLVIPRRLFKMQDGKPVFLPENDTSWMPGEPGRLDDPAGKGWVPLSATYRDEHHRDAKGVPATVSQWVGVSLPPDTEPTTVEDVAARARRDLLIMQYGGSSSLFGVAADAKGDGQNLKPLSRFEPDRITDTEYAAAVRRGIDDLRRFDEVHEIGPADMLPPRGQGQATRK